MPKASGYSLPEGSSAAGYSLSLALIVRNEESRLERCLRSFEGQVDEIVVCDTGSTDRTVEIAEACGARVVHLAWVDDFAAARNFALEHTTGDWRLMADADEWLDRSPESLAALASLRGQVPRFTAQVQIANASPDGNVVVGWVGRVTPANVGYIGVIHEQIDPALPSQQLPIVLHHDGYALAADEMAAKSRRNADLLVKAIGETPDLAMRAYYGFQLAKEHFLSGQWAEAKRGFDEVWTPEVVSQQWAGEMVRPWLISAAQLDQYEALTLIEQLQPFFERRAEYWYTVAEVLVNLGQRSQESAQLMFPIAFNALQTCFSLGEDSEGGTSAIGVGTFLPARLMARLLEMSGQVDEAKKFAELSERMRAQVLAGTAVEKSVR